MYEIPYMNIEALNSRVVENIRTLIDEKGAKPTSLSKAAGLGHTTIVDLLKKPGASPRYDTILKIAKALNVDVRRITIGPEFERFEAQDAELVDLLLQLEPSERQFLLNAAKAQIAARNSHSKPTGEDP